MPCVDKALDRQNCYTPWAAEPRDWIALPLYMPSKSRPRKGIDADIACNLALLLSKPLKKSPQAIARRGVKARPAFEDGTLASMVEAKSRLPAPGSSIFTGR